MENGTGGAHFKLRLVWGIFVQISPISSGIFRSTGLYRSQPGSGAVSQQWQMWQLCTALSFGGHWGDVLGAGRDEKLASFWILRQFKRFPPPVGQCRTTLRARKGAEVQRWRQGYLHLPAKWFVGRKLLWWGEGPKGVVAGCVAPVRTRSLFSSGASDSLCTQSSWPSQSRAGCKGHI